MYNISQLKIILCQMQQDREQSEQISEIPYQDLKIRNQATTKCFLQGNGSSSPSFDFESCIPTSTDVSFQMEMHQDNIQSIKNATLKYLQQCLIGDYNKTDGFKDPQLYKVKPFQIKGQNELDGLILHNDLFNEESIQDIYSMIQEQSSLIGLLRQIPATFGLTVGKQLVYAIYLILKEKLTKYKEMIQATVPIIPKFNRFEDLCDQSLNIFSTSCPIYDELNLEEIISFAQRDNDELTNRLYFSDLKILNLKEITCECNPKIDAIHKRFGKLLNQISKSVFLTIAGATEPHQTLFNLDLSREISFAEFSEVGHLSAHRSFSRPFVPCEEDESCDFISKRIKFQ